MNVFYLRSSNVNGTQIDQNNRQFIQTISEKSGVELNVVEDVKEMESSLFSVVFVGGGGTEGNFEKAYDSLKKPIILMTTGENNSLAASMEILSYLQQKGCKGEILHGDLEYMSSRLSSLTKVFEVKEKIQNLRVGRVGVASDWLISSHVDPEVSKNTTGITLVDISMEEFFEEINKGEYEENKYTLELKSKNYIPEDTEKALEIYGALKRLCQKYNLGAVTVRCFDLLEPVKNTGCVALAILNAEGIYAGCEGDVPSVISMAVIGELSDKPVFMANPSRIELAKKEMVFAHCTLPINMPTAFRCMTHFESGLGVAFQAELPLGDITIFKCSGLLDRYFVSHATIKENLHESNLCRTQIRIHMEQDLDYFLTRSIGNHHLIVVGDHREIVKEFFQWF